LLEDYNDKTLKKWPAQMAQQANDLYPHPSFILSYSVDVASGLALGEPLLKPLKVCQDVTLLFGEVEQEMISLLKKNGCIHQWSFHQQRYLITDPGRR
jgi:hypothetical protein